MGRPTAPGELPFARQNAALAGRSATRREYELLGESIVAKALPSMRPILPLKLDRRTSFSDRHGLARAVRIDARIDAKMLAGIFPEVAAILVGEVHGLGPAHEGFRK